MDADSSYGGSDTAQDSHCSLDTSHNSHNNSKHDHDGDKVTTAVHVIPDETQENEPPVNHYYHKNEITVPVNLDQTDFQKNTDTKLPHYLATANLNINESLENHNNLEEMSRNYKSQHKLHDSFSKKSKNGSPSGIDNPGFVEDVKSTFHTEMPYSKGLVPENTKTNNHEPVTEAVNLELINMKPGSPLHNGLKEYDNTGMTTIPLKKEEEDVRSPYDEYFVPVNEHRKYMRGEKLYVTKDNRVEKSKSKCICWAICIAVIAIAVLLGILAAVGLIGYQAPLPQAVEVRGRSFENDTPISKGGLSLPGNGMKPPLTPEPPITTISPILPSTDESQIYIPRVLETEFRIENLEFNPNLLNKSSTDYKHLAKNLENVLERTLFTEDEQKNGPMEFYIKVVDMVPGSVVIRYRLNWTPRIENDDYSLDEMSLQHKLPTYLKDNNNQLTAFNVSHDSVQSQKVLDMCKIQNNGCKHLCMFDYTDLEFKCICPCNEHCENPKDQYYNCTSEPENENPEPEFVVPTPEPTAEPTTERQSKEESLTPALNPVIFTTDRQLAVESSTPEPTTTTARQLKAEESTPEPTTTKPIVEKELNVSQVSRVETEYTTKSDDGSQTTFANVPLDHQHYSIIVDPQKSSTTSESSVVSESSSLEMFTEKHFNDSPTSNENTGIYVKLTDPPSEKSTTTEETVGVHFYFNPNHEDETEKHTTPKEDYPGFHYYFNANQEASDSNDNEKENMAAFTVRNEATESKVTHFEMGNVYTPPAEVHFDQPKKGNVYMIQVLKPNVRKEAYREPKIQEHTIPGNSSEEMNATDIHHNDSMDSSEHNHDEYMSPFLPELDNDTFVNSLHSEEHFTDHENHDHVSTIKSSTVDNGEEISYKVNNDSVVIFGSFLTGEVSTTTTPASTEGTTKAETTKPPSLEFDQLNRTNPFDNNTSDAGKLKQDADLEIEPLKPEVTIIISDKNEVTTNEPSPTEMDITTKDVTTMDYHEVINVQNETARNIPIVDSDIQDSTTEHIITTENIISEHETDNILISNAHLNETQESMTSQKTEALNQSVSEHSTTETTMIQNDGVAEREITTTETSNIEISKDNETSHATSEHVIMSEQITTEESIENSNITNLKGNESVMVTTTTEKTNNIHIVETLGSETTTIKNKNDETSTVENKNETETYNKDVLIHVPVPIVAIQTTTVKETPTTDLPPMTTEEVGSTNEPPVPTLPADIINIVHSNSYFDELTKSIESETTPSLDHKTNYSTTNVNNFNDITSSTEDLIALETTTNVDGNTLPPVLMEENKTKLNESKSNENKTIKVGGQIVETVTTVVNVKTEDEKEQENEISTETSSATTLEPTQYQVKETITDITTTEKLFVTHKTTTEAIQPEDDSTEELGIIPLEHNDAPETKKQKKYISFESNEISDEEKVDNSIEKISLKTKNNDQVKPVTEDFVLPKVWRCLPGQFECLNGTSVKDGSYCINIGDRCDSVLDCTDGSDEVHCMEEGCPNNFQCASKQCLKRHLVCDGILNCNDGSDEINCESWRCNANEFSCGLSDRCIPASWKCDQKRHCPDGSDEVGCTHSGPCPVGSFRCSEESSCMPNSWKCDGERDCPEGEDEVACNCSKTEFKCHTGGGCISKTSRCDGTAQCLDKSDEQNCLKLDNFILNTTDTSDKKILQIQAENNTWYPICMDWTLWNTTFADLVCQNLGYSASSALESVPKPTQLTPKTSYVLSLLSEHEQSLHFVENRISNCDQYVSITCQEYVCGSPTALDGPSARIVGGDKAAPTQWPSLALLHNKRSNVYCTSSLVTPLWAVTSYSCIAGHTSQPIHEDDWLLYAGGTNKGDNFTSQVRKLREIVIHPQTKFSNFGFTNDAVLLKLRKPVHINLNVSAVCLPNGGTEPRQLCVVAGWGINKPGEPSIQQYLHYLPVPLIDIAECNSTKHYNGKITDDKICAGYTDSDKTPCFNDEGAPLMCFADKTATWELHGLLSHHGNCGSTNKHPAIYTAINPNLRSWMTNIIGRQVYTTT